MSSFLRITNRSLAKIYTRLPYLGRRITEAFSTVQTKGVPWSPPRKQLSDSKVALVTTAGVHHRDQPPFDMHDREGDPSFRVIDVSRPVSDLMITHDYYDHSDADKDINVVFPIERLQELESEEIIGQVARFHYGFMGHILGQHIETLVNQSAPDVARRLKADAIDLVLLTPGWGICNQSVGLIQREVEAAGISTIGISIVRSFSEKIKPPRTVFLPWPFGHPMGEPFNVAQQRTVLIAALDALHSISTPAQIVDLPYK